MQRYVSHGRPGPSTTCRLAWLAAAALCVTVWADTALESITVTHAATSGGGDLRSGEDLRHEIGALWDITRAFASLPGAVSTSDRTANLSVRGGDPTENLVRVDGVDIPSIGHMAWQGETGGVVSLLSPAAVEDAVFHVGALPARYGGRMSSVLDIRLREGRRGRIQGSGEMSPAGVAGLLEGGFRQARGSWIASYRAGLLDLVRRPAQLTAVPAYRDGHAKVSYDVSPNGRITAFALVGSSRVDVTRDGADPTDEFATTKRAAGATWTQRHARGARTRVTLSDVASTYDAQAWDPPIREAAYTNASTERRSGVEGAVDLGVGRDVAVTLGAEWQRVSIAHDIASRPWQGFSENAGRLLWLGRQQVDDERVGHRFTGYIEASHSPVRRLTVNAGLRGTRLTLTDSAGLQPRLAAVLRVADRTELRLAAGIVRQSPSYLELTIDDANASLPDASATHVVTGVTRHAGRGVTVAGEAYIKSYRHLRALANEGAKRPSCELSSTRERSTRGVELQARRRTPRSRIALVAALSRATGRSEPGGRAYRDDFDYRHVVTLTGARDVGSTWTLGAKWQFVGGRPYTAYVAGDTLVGGFEVAPNESGRNEERYPSYRRLDLQVTRRVRWVGHDVGLFVEARNALNRANVRSWHFDSATGAFEPVHQLPRLILVGLTAALPRL